jgi:hypothetical protein
VSASRWRVVVDVARDGGVRCFHRKSGHTSRRLLVVVLLHCSRGRARRTYVRTVRATTHACWARREAERRSAATRATARAASPCPRGARIPAWPRTTGRGGRGRGGPTDRKRPGGRGTAGEAREAGQLGSRGYVEYRGRRSSGRTARGAHTAAAAGRGSGRQASLHYWGPDFLGRQALQRRPSDPVPNFFCVDLFPLLPLLQCTAAACLCLCPCWSWKRTTLSSLCKKKNPHTLVALHHHVPPTTYMTLSTVLASRYGNTVLVTRCLATIHRTNRNFIVVTFFLCVCME